MSAQDDTLDLVRRTLEAVPGAMILVGVDGTIRGVNTACARMFGYRRDALIGQPIELLVPEAHHATHREQRQAFLREPRVRLMASGRDTRGLHRDGHAVRVRVDLNPSPLTPGQAALCSLVELTPGETDREQIHHLRQELDAVRRELQACAATDGLTGLRNRRALMEQLELEIERSLRSKRAISLALLDLDRFKRYNDRFGHSAGDEVLRQVARLLRIRGRASDVIGRYAGKAFCVLMPDTDRAGALVAAGRWHQAIQAEHWSYRTITASIGVASFLPESEPARPVAKSATHLLADADEALSRAKLAGRNRVIHSADLELT